MHSAGFEFAKLTYTRLEDNLVRHGAIVMYNMMSHIPCIYQHLIAIYPKVTVI